MPRALWIVLVGMMAAPAAASAAPALESIAVTAPKLTGYWSLEGPSLIEVKMGLLSGIRIIYSGGTMTRDICRISRQNRDIVTVCSGGLPAVSDGGVTQDQVRLRWWSGPANLIFTGTWDRKDTIVGGFSGGIAGIRVTGGVPATLHKLTLPPAGAGGKDALMALVLGDLRQGALTDGRYEPGALKRVWRTEQWRYVKDDNARLTYLGEIHVRWQKGQPRLQESVYEVRSGADVSLCRIAVSPHRLVDDFACREAS